MFNFIKVTDIDKDCSDLTICIDSIEKFHRSKEGYIYGEVKLCSHIYLKGHGSYNCVNETPEEIEVLINKARLIDEDRSRF